MGGISRFSPRCHRFDSRRWQNLKFILDVADIYWRCLDQWLDSWQCWLNHLVQLDSSTKNTPGKSWTGGILFSLKQTTLFSGSESTNDEDGGKKREPSLQRGASLHKHLEGNPDENLHPRSHPRQVTINDSEKSWWYQVLATFQLFKKPNVASEAMVHLMKSSRGPGFNHC